MRIWLLIALAACGHPSHVEQPTGEVRWPVERRAFVGTVAHAGGEAMLELEDGPYPISPPLRARVALRGAELADGAQVVVSGVGRRLERAETEAGAVIALDAVRVEAEARGAVRYRTELEVEVRKTKVVVDGVLVERGDSFLIQLDPTTYLRTLIVVEGVGEARRLVGTHVRARGYLLPTTEDIGWSTDGLHAPSPPPADVIGGLALAQPAFL